MNPWWGLEVNRVDIVEDATTSQPFPRATEKTDVCLCVHTSGLPRDINSDNAATRGITRLLPFIVDFANTGPESSESFYPFGDSVLTVCDSFKSAQSIIVRGCC